MRIFITHILPQDRILKYKLSVAACNFSWNLIEDGVFDRFYSIMPLYVRSKLDDVEMPELVYSSLRTKGRLLSKLAVLCENWRIYRQMPKDCSIWFYNMSTLNLPLFFLLRWFRKRTKVNIIILDYTPGKNWSSRLCLWAYNHCDGTITLAQSPLFTIKNTFCLPGVTPNTIVSVPKQSHINKEILLSGVLNERIAMLSMILDAFSKLPDLTLHITGFVNDDSVFEKYKTNKNIIYHGKLSYEEYLNIFHRCSFLLSSRNPYFEENMCNFPSKIMEALLHNRIVISTLCYNQLKDVKYFVVSSSSESFVRDLTNIFKKPEEQLLDYANQSDVVIANFSSHIWNQTMKSIEEKRIN